MDNQEYLTNLKTLKYPKTKVTIEKKEEELLLEYPKPNNPEGTLHKTKQDAEEK